MTPEISIVIPTINRYADLKNTLTDLKNQSFQHFEILIIDQTDKEFAQEIVFDKTRSIWKSFKSASKARNVALLEAKSPIVLFLDDDVIINNKNFIKNHVKHFQNPEVAGVAGAILNLDEKWADSLPVKTSKNHLGWLYFPRNYNKPTEVTGGGSGNLAVRKDWAIAIGGMDENYDKGAYREESDFCLRYTNKYGKFIFDPSAYLVHIGSPTGGTRSWKNSNGIIHPQQHMIGSWYFMFVNLPKACWLEYGYFNTRRFIVHKKLIFRFYLLPQAIVRFTSAFFIALKLKTNGPKLLLINE